MATRTDVLTDPVAFFERQDPSLRSGLVVVLAAATLRAAVALPILYTFRFVIPREEMAVAVGASLGLMYAFALVRWLLLAGVVYGVSRAMGGGGRFRDLLGYLGWSHLPNVLAGTLMLAVTGAVVLTVQAPTTEAEAGRTAAELAANPVARLSSAYGTVEARTGVSLGQLQTALGVGQLAWGAVLWFAAAKVGLGLDGRQALLAVAVPILVGGVVVGIPAADIGISL